jgi:hypothetical protein
LSVAALRHRDFRLLWAGLLLSFIGTFMQSATVLWLVYGIATVAFGLSTERAPNLEVGCELSDPGSRSRDPG